MKKLTKCILVAAACILLTGCPKATAVTGTVTGGIPGGYAVERIGVGSFLGVGSTYFVAAGSSVTVTYDNGKTCTFTGETSFVPGSDGSVCQQDNNDKKKQDKKDDKQDQQQDQDQQQQQQQQQQDAGQQGQEQGQTSNGGTNASSGINAPPVPASSVPQYSGIGGPQVIATAVPTYTRIMSVINNPILTTTLSVIGAAAVVKEVHDQTNGSDKPDEPVSK
jgi:hypothetical protein